MHKSREYPSILPHRMLTVVSLFDTLALLNRDLAMFHHMARSSLKPEIPDDLKVSLSLNPSVWKGTNSAFVQVSQKDNMSYRLVWEPLRFHNAVVGKLASALEGVLGVPRTNISLAEKWRVCTGPGGVSVIPGLFPQGQLQTARRSGVLLMEQDRI